MKDESIFKVFAGGIFLFWVVGAIMGLATSGLIVYILYRLATHPW